MPKSVWIKIATMVKGKKAVMATFGNFIAFNFVDVTIVWNSNFKYNFKYIIKICQTNQGNQIKPNSIFNLMVNYINNQVPFEYNQSASLMSR